MWILLLARTCKQIHRAASSHTSCTTTLRHHTDGTKLQGVKKSKEWPILTPQPYLATAVAGGGDDAAGVEQCMACTPCPPGTQEVSACTASADRVCAACDAGSWSPGAYCTTDESSAANNDDGNIVARQPCSLPFTYLGVTHFACIGKGIPGHAAGWCPAGSRHTAASSRP